MLFLWGEEVPRDIYIYIHIKVIKENFITRMYNQKFYNQIIISNIINKLLGTYYYQISVIQRLYNEENANN